MKHERACELDQTNRTRPSFVSKCYACEMIPWPQFGLTRSKAEQRSESSLYEANEKQTRSAASSWLCKQKFSEANHQSDSRKSGREPESLKADRGRVRVELLICRWLFIVSW